MIDYIHLIPLGRLGAQSIRIPLVPSDPDEAPYIITNVEGLGPVSASINITPYASGDGGVFNSSRKDSRNIVITMKLGKKPSMEDNRRNMFNTCQTGKKIAVDVYFKENYLPNMLQFQGYTESVACDYFGDQEGIQVSIVCPNPGPDIYTTDKRSH